MKHFFPLILSLFVLTPVAMFAQSNSDSPYALFGDSTHYLDAKKEVVHDCFRVCVMTESSDFFFVDFNFRKGTATLTDNYGNEYLVDSISDYARAMFTSVDPKSEKFYGVSPYSYCGGDPINSIDPNGMETRVIQNEDGTYQVIGGVLNDDRNIYLYTQDEDGNYTVRGASIGQTTSTTSFWDSDQADNENGGWAVGSIINPNDNSGISFLNQMVSSDVTLDQYLDKARNDQPWDFKVTNGENIVVSKEHSYKYRGMPIGTSIDGSPLYTSARDVGNIGAGIVAAKNGISWGAARIAFDVYQGKPEGISTRNAQAYGWSMTNRHLASPNMVHTSITNTIKHFIQNILR